MIDGEVSGKVLNAAFKVHTALGPGLLEKVYEECLCYELLKTGLEVERQKPMPLVYETVKMDCGYRLDLFVEKSLVVEVKAVEVFNDVHTAQLLTYLRLANIKLGLLINFKVVHLRDGIKRIYNNR